MINDNRYIMKKIRIGKDIEVRWRILTDREPLPLAGRDLWLEIVNGYGRQGHEFSIEDGNEVVFTFGGLEQRHPGVHTFTLWENRGKAGQTVVDSCDGVELVRSTCMEGGDGGNVSSETSDLFTESINLSSVNLGTETDSYTKEEADAKFQAKSDQALETEDKTVVGAINELRSSVPEYTAVPALTSAYTVPANPTATERIYAIAIGATAYPVTGAEGIVWQDGTPPEVESNSTLVVSVFNNLAVWGTFKKEA